MALEEKKVRREYGVKTTRAGNKRKGGWKGGKEGAREEGR